MGRPPSKGPYVPLAANFYLDDAILEAGPEAELLFVRILSFLASVPSDGFITDRQLRTVVALGLRNVTRRVDSLLKVGLLEERSGGYLARSWQKWNRSAEEVGRLRAKDRERKARDSGVKADNSERNPVGIQADSSPQYRAVQSSTEQSSTEGTPDGVLLSDAAASDAEFAPEVEYLCTTLAGLVKANGHKAVIGKQWRQAADRLIRIDGYDPKQIEWVMRWATADEFWQANIRSMPKLREKFSELKSRALAEHRRLQSGNRAQERQAGNLAVVGQLAALDAADQRGISA